MSRPDWKTLPLRFAAALQHRTDRLLKAGGCVVVGMVLGGCSVPPVQDGAKQADSGVNGGNGIATAEQASSTVTLRPRWPERLTRLEPAAIAVNKSSVTPYPGEPESGDGVTAYGAGLRPPADLSRRGGADGGDEDEDDDEDSFGGVLVDKGLASWYGGQFHGRLTASGERFDRGDMTAAHRTLPFGSKVCVRNISTGKTVLVRINDRGPFAPGRVIDLSQAAARELGIQGLGIKPVELWKLDSRGESCPDEFLSANSNRNSNGSADRTAVPVDAVAEVGTSGAPSKARGRQAGARKPSAHTSKAAKSPAPARTNAKAKKR